MKRKVTAKSESTRRETHEGPAQYLWTILVAVAVAVAAMHQSGLIRPASATDSVPPLVIRSGAPEVPKPASSEASRFLSSLH